MKTILKSILVMAMLIFAMENVNAKTDVEIEHLGERQTHTLRINPPSNDVWNFINVVDETGEYSNIMYFGMGDYFELELEEGNYYIFCGGFRNDGLENLISCFWNYDINQITEDFVVNIDFSDCDKKIYINAVNEDGVPMQDIEFKDVIYTCAFYWRDQIPQSVTYDLTLFQPEMSYVRFNSFTSGCSIRLKVNCECGNMKSYYLDSGLIDNLEDDVTFSVTADELHSHSEIFYANPRDINNLPLVYHIDVMEYDEEYDYYSTPQLYYWSMALVYEIGNPLTLVTNYKNLNDGNHPTVFFFNVAEYIDFYGMQWPAFEQYIGTAISFDEEGRTLKETMPIFKNGAWINNEMFPTTPLHYIVEPDVQSFNGFRTPLANYLMQAYNAENSGMGMIRFGGKLQFAGENGCERISDGDAIIHVKLNDEVIYSDSLYKFNFEGVPYIEEAGEVTVELTNNHLTVDGISKTNVFESKCNLGNDDAMSPTMTFMRINDNYGNENIELYNINGSSIVFGCGDYSWHFNPEWNCFDYPIYTAKPSVEVFYSTEETNWEALVIAEDETLFHENYGNVFTIDLSQLDGKVNDHWVNLKFVVTDEAGNSQTQELSNVFYVGQQTSVNEVTTLAHTIYPNPFTNEVRINAAEAVNGNASISVFNVLGEQVISKAMNCSETTEFVIDGSSLNAGIYFYNISTENGELKGRIVKE